MPTDEALMLWRDAQCAIYKLEKSARVADPDRAIAIAIMISKALNELVDLASQDLGAGS